MSETGWLTIPPGHNAHEKLKWKFFGKTYLDVRGGAPFYLEIPSRNAILFVTGIDGQAVVHLVNNTTHHEVSFSAFDSHIGKMIGTNSSPALHPNAAHEEIEAETGDMLTITAGNWGLHAKYFIDLKTPRFIREEGEYTSSAAPSPPRYVYESGIKPPPL